MIVLLGAIPNLAFAEISNFGDLDKITSASLSTNSYIVKLKTEEDKVDLENFMLGIENKTGIKKVKEEYENLPYLLLNLTSKEVSDLERNPGISFIELDKEIQLTDIDQPAEDLALTSPIHIESKNSFSKFIGTNQNDIDQSNANFPISSENSFADQTVSSVTYDTYINQPETVDNLVYGIDFFSWGHKKLKVKELHERDIKGSGVRVAIFDTGVDMNHDDLELAGGVSFVGNSYDDDNGHGTKMAGIIQAKINNFGIGGLAPNVDLYAVKMLDQSGKGTYSNVIHAIDWAIENNINIINMSITGFEFSKSMKDATQRAWDAGILIVGASGNSNSPKVSYPSGYRTVMSVGAVTYGMEKAPFSNYGAGLDISAPGEGIITTSIGNKYESASGTSVAASFVSAAAAEVWSSHPDWDVLKIRKALLDSAESIGDKELFGYGLVDPLSAIDENFIRNTTIDPSGIEEGDGDPDGEVEISTTDVSANPSIIELGDTSTIKFNYKDKAHPTVITVYRYITGYGYVQIGDEIYINTRQIEGQWTFRPEYLGNYKIHVAPNDRDNIFGDDAFVTVKEPASLESPSNLRVTSTESTITLSWDSVNGATSYKALVYGQSETTLPIGRNSITFDQNLNPNTLYRVGVAAVNSKSQSEYSIKSVTTQKETVIVIAGMAASAAFYQGNQIWKPRYSHLYGDVGLLKVDSNGEALNSDVTFKNSEYPTGQPLLEFYGPLIEYLKTDYNVVPFGYDFRRNNEMAAQELKTLINSLNVKKVSIVGHSMGGLVATKYIQNARSVGEDDKVRKLITLGTPYLGAPKAYATMNSGFFLSSIDKTPLKDKAGDLLLRNFLMGLAKNSVGVNELLPTQNYFLSNQYYIKKRTDKEWDYTKTFTPMSSYSTTKSFLNSDISSPIFNSYIYNKSESFHNQLDIINTLNSIRNKLYIIAGYNLETPGIIIPRFLKGVNGLETFIENDMDPVNGDKTVPLWSASVAENFQSRMYYAMQVEHSDLPKDAKVQAQVKNILAGGSADILTRSIAKTKTLKIKVENPVNNTNGNNKMLKSSNFQTNSINSTSDSLIDLNVYDINGAHLGPNPDGSIDDEVNTGSYYESGVLRYALLNEDNYQVKLLGTGNGSITYTVQQFDKSDYKEKTYRFDNVSVTPTTIISSNTNFNQGIVLNVDVDGDGTIDKIIQPSVVLNGAQSQDEDPPETIISHDGMTNDDWNRSNVNVTLQAHDNVNGIMNIQYTINDNPIFSIYDRPILLDRDGIYTIKAYSTDNNLNPSSFVSKEIRIDKTAPEKPVIEYHPIDWTNEDAHFTVINGNDLLSGTKKSQYKIGNGPWIDFNSETVISEEGITSISARSIDNAGNISDITEVIVYIDKTAPNAPEIVLSHQDWSPENVTFYIDKPDDALSGVKYFQYRLGTTGPWMKFNEPVVISNEGETLVYARAVDMAGNKSNETFAVVKVDKTPPSVPQINADTLEWINTDVNFSIVPGVDLLSGVSRTEYKINTGAWIEYKDLPIKLTEEGVYHVSARSIDLVGNISDEALAVIKIDKTPPSKATITLSNTKWTQDDVKVTITDGVDTLSGVKKSQYKINQGDWVDYTSIVTLHDEGISTVYARTIDLAGNISDEVYAKVYIDRTPPNKPTDLTVLPFLTGKGLTSVTLTWGESIDPIGEIKEYEIYMDSKLIGSTTNLNFTIKDLKTDSLYNFYVVAKDEAGNSSEQSNAIDVYTRRTMIQASGNQSFLLKSERDGTLSAWGSNSYGQLGDGTKYTKTTATDIPLLSGIASISAGDQHTVAVKNDGSVVAWGYNYAGQLGDGTTTQRSVPVAVSGLTSGFIGVAAGSSQSFALKGDGTVWGWGQGYGSTPVSISGLNGIVAIASSSTKGMALKSDGTVWTWSTGVAVSQVSGLSGITAIALGNGQYLALKGDGTVWSWGTSDNGELGSG
ncbi:alpha/beta fold hydrolase, partial [Paenibacillus sp. GCM10012306]|uniref:alpha/beta fold hydrolase n=1 Tax=Paenibacillus sp. GCM10012306 TaxID=3317342 RepID=UPI003613EFCC